MINSENGMSSAVIKKFIQANNKKAKIILTQKKNKKQSTNIDSHKINSKPSPRIDVEDSPKYSIIHEMKKLRDEIHTEKSGYRENHRKNIADAYNTSILIKHDTDMRLELETHAEWEKFSAKGRTKKDPSSLLVAVLNYLFGNQTRLKRKKTSKIKRALEPYFYQDSSPTIVRDLIMKGGLPNLIKNQPLIEGAATQTKRSPKNELPEQSIEFILKTDKFYEDIMDLDEGTLIRTKLKITKKITSKIFMEMMSLKETDN